MTSSTSNSIKVKKMLEKINKISRQLLSRILVVQNTIQEKPNVQYDSEVTEQVTEHELTELMHQRQNLIRNLFEQYSADEVSLEVNLFDETVALDSELSKKSQLCKQDLAEQVIKLKKSKKVKKSYQSSL
ncbi:MAG: hypothetical protein JJV99_05050 [Colwellia sp.]|nr:hypothetical protein [Colwellia sp.]